MKLLVVGASGFIAPELIRSLENRPDVMIIAGARWPEAARFPQGVEVRALEAAKPESIASAMRGATLAAETKAVVGDFMSADDRVNGRHIPLHSQDDRPKARAVVISVGE